MKTFTPRNELVQQLIARDGLKCQYVDCNHMLDPNAPEGPRQLTIDHTMPQAWCKEHGWSDEQIWDLSNLTLMCKKGNASKGDRVPNADGSLPPKEVTRFKYRRQKRMQRAEVCTACTAGRDLAMDEVCAACGTGPMPERYPRWAKVPSKECDHGAFWCYMCACGLVDRIGAAEMIMLHGEGGEGSTGLHDEDDLTEAKPQVYNEG